SRESGKAGHRGKGSRHLGGSKELRTAIGCQYVAQSRGRENEGNFSQIGAPDALRGACPVRGGLGGIPLLRGSMDAVLLLHSVSPRCSMKSMSSWALSPNIPR